MRAKPLGCWVALALAGAPAALVAQQGTRLAPGAAIETYSFAEPDKVGLQSITLVTMPFAARAAAGPLLLSLHGAYASGTATTRGNVESRLSGLTDTELRLDWAVVRDQVTLTVRGVLPTGRDSQSAEELVVASVVLLGPATVSSEQLGYRRRSRARGCGEPPVRRFGGRAESWVGHVGRIRCPRN